MGKIEGGWWKKEGEYSDDATTKRVPSPPLVQQESCSVKCCATRDDACSRRCTTRELE